jgi:hypothetical protein
MANTYKRLGAINPSANTQTNVYVVPASTEAVISTIAICNQTGTATTYSLALMPSSIFASPAGTAHFLVRNAALAASDTIFLTVGLTGNAGSVLVANTPNSNISFSAFGSEIT